MAIVFIKSLEPLKLRMAYNNDVIKFYSNNSTTIVKYADVIIDTPGSVPDVTMRLYPAPDGTFTCNLKPYIVSLINKRNFEDTTQTNINSNDITSFFYDNTIGTILKKNLNIVIPGESYTVGLFWIAGVEQLGLRPQFDMREFYVMSPYDKNTYYHNYIKYWQGYPFDLPFFYGNNITANINNYKIKNETNLLDMSFTIDKTGSVNLAGRLFFSDGRTDETLEDLLPLVEGYNKLIWSKVGQPSTKDKFITLEKMPYRCGVYFKWLNKYGGYNYWLFENTYSIDRTSKQLGELSRDNDNLEDTFSNAIQIGKDSQDTIKVIAELIPEHERIVLEGIIDSPKIYMFTGQPFARNGFRDWVEVSLKTTNTRVKNPKQQLTNFVFDFELPQRYTQTL
jgi:hypothetical protein